MNKPFTGRHMTAILVGLFGVVITVNLVMARYASSTFGGVVVENSYVASQKFNDWLQEADRQRALGWDAVTTWRPDNRLAVQLHNVPAGATLAGSARHPLGQMSDRDIAFTTTGKNRFLSTSELPEGRWLLRLEVSADAQIWRSEEELR